MVAVTQLDRYSGCMKCTSKVVPMPDDPELGTCVKCETMQCVDGGSEELIANIVVRLSRGGNCALRAFGQVVRDICQVPGGEITMKTLLKAKPFSICYKDGIIQSISRKVIGS